MKPHVSLAVVAIALLSSTAGARPAAPLRARSHVYVPDPVVVLDREMRKLWEDHIAFTRNYIVSAIGGLPDTDAVALRLMKNQDAIGDALKPFYGPQLGDALTKLLREHIRIAADVVKAAKAQDTLLLEVQQRRWLENANDIAKLLSDANPNWKRVELEDMLHRHLDLTTREVTARLQKDWAEDIAAYDAGHEHMLMFADDLAAGIARQFPKNFTR